MPLLSSDPRAEQGRRLSWRLVLAVGAAVLVVLVALLHAPFVRSRVLSLALDRLQQTGIALDASRLDYNLLRLSATLHGATLTAVGADVPFLRADRVFVDLPRAVLGGNVWIDTIELDRPRVTIVRGADGSLNLPTSEDDDNAPSQPLRIDRLIVRDLDVSYEDPAQPLTAAARGLSLDMSGPGPAPLEGDLTMAGGATLRLAGRETTLTTLQGRLGFDGTRLSADPLVVQAPELQVQVAGRIGLLEDDPAIDLRYEGQLDLARIAPWTGLGETVAGLVRFAGSADGPTEAPALGVDVEADRITWAPVGDISLRSRVAMSGRVIEVESLAATIAGGALDGEARVALDADASSSLAARWRGLDLGTLVRAIPDTPLRVASSIDGTAALDWTGSDVTTAVGRLAATLRAPAAPSGALPLAGRIDVTVDRGQWTLALDDQVPGVLAVQGTAAGRLDHQLTASSLGGTLELQAGDIEAALHTLESAGLSIGDAAEGLGGGIHLEAALSGTFGAPRARGTFEARDVRFRGAGPGTAQAGFDATPARVAIGGLRLEVGPNLVSGDVTAGLPSGMLAGHVTAHLPDLAAITRALPALWQSGGSAQLDARLAGTVDRPAIDVQLSARDLELAGQPIRTLETTARLERQVLTVESFEAAQDEGRLRATGRYDIAGGRYLFQATGDDLVLTSSRPLQREGAAPAAGTVPIDARFALTARGEGTVESPQAEGVVNFSHLDWRGHEFGTVRAEGTLAGGEARVHVDVPSLAASARATTTLATKTFVADVELTGTELSVIEQLVRRATRADMAADAEADSAVPVIGTLAARGHAEGRLDAVAETAATVELTLDGASVNDVPVRLEAPARIDYQQGQLAVDLVLATGDAELTARGAAGTSATGTPGIDMALTGPLSDLMPLVHIVPAARGYAAEGAIDLRLLAGGTIEVPRIEAALTLTGASLTAEGLPPIGDIAIEATYDEGLLEIPRLGASWQGAVLTGSGRLPAAILGDRLPAQYRASLPDVAGPATASLRVASATPAVLAPFVTAETLSRIDGHLDVVADVEASSLDAAGVEGEVVFERAEMNLAGVPLAQTAPTRLRLAGSRFEIAEWNWAGAGNRLDLTGGVALGGEGAQLDVGVAGALDMRMLGAFLPEVATSGRLTIDATAKGPAAQPLVNGEVAFDDVDVVVRDPRIVVDGFRGQVLITPERIELRDVAASANGGTIELSGGMDHQAFRPTGGSLMLTGRELAFEIPEGLRTGIDADLILVAAGGEQALVGGITVRRGAYREPLSLAEFLLTSNTGRPVAPADDEPGPLADLQLGIALITAENVVVDNNYGELEVASNVTIAGTPDEPLLAGRLTVQPGGEVFLGGQTYELQRGTVDFLNPSRIEPTFDFALETRVGREEITLEVSGTPAALDVNLRSPGLSQQDALSLLLTGRMADESMAAGAEVARSQLLMLLSGEVLSLAGRAVGLDAVQLSRGLGGAASDFDLLASETDPGARLTLSKYLSRDVELVVSQSLRESGDITWIANYRPLRNLEFRGTTADDNSRAYEFRHELSFGGTSAAPTLAPTEDAPAPLVTGVRFTGTPGFPESELQGRLRLEPGDRFDFYRWQQDRDRLIALYHDRGFLEARVAARRQEDGPDASGVLLAYDIDQGPRAALTIVGFDIPGDTRARMRQAWAEAVFDGFLLDDLQRLALESLAREGYLQAEVTAAVAPPAEPGVKEIVLHVTPGARVGDRRFAFSGNREVEAGDLEDVIEVRDLELEAFLDPAMLVQPLERHYQTLGYLSAEVMPGEPQVSGRTATLPVEISEGPLFHVRRVDVAGVSARPEHEVREAFTVEAGAPFVPGELEPARRAVEAAYLADGFTDVEVTVETSADPDGAAVDVLLRVEEGPRHVLVGIDVAGAEVTSQSTIARAVDLEIGGPASLGGLYRAQKRLYDTGVLRSVNVAFEPVTTGDDAVPGVQPVRASVALEELPLYTFRYGVRLTDEVGPAEIDREIRPALVVDLVRRNLFGRAISTGIAGQIEGDRRLARGIVSLPTLFGLPIASNLFLSRSRQDFTPEGETPFVEDALSFNVEQRFRVAGTMAVSYGYNFSRTHVFEPDPNPANPLPIDLRANVGRLTWTYAWDTRDDPSNASRGWFHSSGFEFGPEVLGSDLRFVRYLAQQYYFRPVGGGVVLASAFRMGAGRGFAGQSLIPSERFFAGGGSSVRGFAEDGLGEVDFFGDPVGGAGLLLLNQEVRFPIFRWIRGAAFVDAGAVFPRASDIAFSQLDAGTGIGLRIASPFALLRVDLATPLTRREREPATRWYFAIGQTF